METEEWIRTILHRMCVLACEAPGVYECDASACLTGSEYVCVH